MEPFLKRVWMPIVHPPMEDITQSKASIKKMIKATERQVAGSSDETFKKVKNIRLYKLRGIRNQLMKFEELLTGKITEPELV